MTKAKNYYGLTNGEYLGYNAGRKEKYYYCIFADGSERVQIETEKGCRYIFGNIQHCRNLYKKGISFKTEALTDNFVNALSA